MIYATARMKIPDANLEEALEILRSVAEMTRFEEGCVSCNVYREAGSENTIFIEAVWKNEKDLERHLRSEEYRKILLVAEMGAEPPEIKFHTIQRTAGVETIRKARGAIEG